MMNVFQELQEQRWDDHRYYHQSRINQSLHLLSAFSFLTAYAYLTINPVVSALMGWGLAMVSRQIGHFFFEPKDYDKVNRVTHEHKEDIKVGYNLKRKVVLLSIWALTPVVLWFQPAMFGLMEPFSGWSGYLYSLSVLWIGLGGAALVFRTVQLFFIRDVSTGLVWFLKILTDPFHDIKMYYRSPFYLMRGQLIDPMTEVSERAATTMEDEERVRSV
ncbi:hypothetical protein C8D92_101259 [Tamilnaduibacter salinus]|uniref:DUF962 domain-containing protein n=1 Tax=Tamilnaduibacter salinus TaxID=1484056 RepID=A0A2A2I2E9_9GAMM|nr:hypothetical protein [Tamilnaduibacter salinus]PAV25183.1 hypothetical protein CF392_12275 [Tamilnaduibacter salinus]PVY79053.1 hypothetical protein C8D92_101259 [Tamilnaduibacter salinus]